MQLRIMTEPQFGASYDDLLAVARRAEDCGFDAFFRSDHFLTMGGDGLPGPTDAWTTLSALGRETSRIRLGTLVSSATFRLPGLLAVQVAQADAMSAGRVELGLGAGWFEDEHTAYGIPFPPTRERFDRLEEQLQIVTGLWGTRPGERFSFSGEHYVLKDSPALPRPVQDRIPVIVGGTGPRRTPALAARFATEFNVAFRSPDQARTTFGRVRDACTALGRDREPLYSVMVPVAVGRDGTEQRRRAAAFGGATDVGVFGSPGQAVDRLGDYAAAGCSRVYLQVLDLHDLDHLDLLASEVMDRIG